MYIQEKYTAILKQSIIPNDYLLSHSKQNNFHYFLQ